MDITHLQEDLAKERYYLQELERSHKNILKKGRQITIENSKWVMEKCKERISKLEDKFKKQVKL